MLEKIRVIDELRQRYSLIALLKFAGVSRSTFYYHISKNINSDKYKDLKEDIQRIYYENNSRYGYRRITLELKRQGMVINHKLVRKLMSILGLKGIVKRKKYKSYQGEVGKSAPNVIMRDFKASKPNEKWTTDVSEFRITDGKLYLSPILDMYNGEIVSYDINTSPNAQQTNKMLQRALNKFDDLKGLVLHSDQGWQYRMRDYQEMLNKRSIIQSMSRRGNCLDNAIMESFFGTMKNEMFYGYEKTFKSVEDLKVAMDNYIEYYNYRRIKLRLNGMSPVEYRETFGNVIGL